MTVLSPLSQTQPSSAARDEFLQLVRELAAREVAPRAALLDDGDQDALAVCWRRFTDAGLASALVAQEAGGAGLTADELVAALEELAAADGGVAMSVLLANAAAIAFEPNRGTKPSDGERWVLVPTTRAAALTVCGETLSARIACALGAWGADGLVFVVSGPLPRVFAVAASDSRVVLDRDQLQLGLRGAPAAAVTVDGIAASEPAEAADAVMALLRTGTAAIARGIARHAYKMALDYARLRWQGGGPILEHDAVRDMLSAMAVRLSSPLPALGGPRQALAAKIAESDAAVATTRDAVQVFGGAGYMRETGVEKLMRDAKYCQLFPEPNWVARDELLALE